MRDDKAICLIRVVTEISMKKA